MSTDSDNADLMNSLVWVRRLKAQGYSLEEIKMRVEEQWRRATETNAWLRRQSFRVVKDE